jgi:tRNA threonylcarbamoyladenosine modification (KEOPS) complex  Pcc1 subunit
MSMQVHISDPALLRELVDSFLKHGCIAQPLGGDSCLILHVSARDATEARREVAFFLRAWQLAYPDVCAELTR